MFVRGFFLIISVFSVCLLCGDLFLRGIGWKRGFAASYVWGLMLLLALFQLVAYPLYRLGTSFTLLFRSFSGIVAVLLLCAVLTGLRRKELLSPYSDELRSFAGNARKCVFLVLVLLAALAVHFFMSEGFYYSSSDDGLYLTKGMEAAAQDSLAINDDMAWFGRDNAPIGNFENGSTYSFFLAYLAVVFRVPVVAVAKTFFLFDLLCAHLAAVLWAYDSFAENAENAFRKKLFFLVSYIAFQLFCVKEGSAGTWMTGFLYEGKAILIGVMFPLLLGSCFRLLKRLESFAFREWLSVAVVLLAGVAVSVIGVIFPLILYFSLGTAVLLGTKFRNIRRLWLPALLSALPAAVFALLSFFTAKSAFFSLGGISAKDWVSAGASASVAGTLSAQLGSWKDHFLYAVDFWQFALYLLSAGFILLRGTKEQKILFVLAPAVLLVTFANPFLSDFVAAKITTPIVYWRIFWLFPVYLLPAFVFTELFDLLTGGRLERGIVLAALVLGTLGGFELFRYSVTAPEYSLYPFVKNFGKLINVRPELRHNVYGLNAAAVRTADTVLADWGGEERPRLLFCFNRPFEIRQYTDEIVLVSEVRNYDSAVGNVPGTDVPIREFIQNYPQMEDAEELAELLRAMKADYVCFPGAPAVADPESAGLRFAGGPEALQVWRFEG